MLFLLDQGVPRSTAPALSDLGFSAQHVGELGMATATDAEVLDKARTLEAVVVTLDADFHMLLAINRSTSPSVIRIRVEGLQGPGLSHVLGNVVATAEEKLAQGCAVSVTSSSIRVRMLPLVQ